jgi:hypothetical protein
MLALVIALGGCGPGWHPFVATPAEQPPPDQVIEFHVADTLVRLHGVRITPDSISGVSWLQHTSCDSCRAEFALARVSAMRTGNPGAGAVNLMIPIVAIGLFLAGLSAALAGNAT